MIKWRQFRNGRKIPEWAVTEFDLTEQGNELKTLKFYHRYNYAKMLTFNTIEGDLSWVVTESSTAALKRNMKLMTRTKTRQHPEIQLQLSLTLMPILLVRLLYINIANDVQS